MGFNASNWDVPDQVTEGDTVNASVDVTNVSGETITATFDLQTGADTGVPPTDFTEQTVTLSPHSSATISGTLNSAPGGDDTLDIVLTYNRQDNGTSNVEVGRTYITLNADSDSGSDRDCDSYSDCYGGGSDPPYSGDAQYFYTETPQYTGIDTVQQSQSYLPPEKVACPGDTVEVSWEIVGDYAYYRPINVDTRLLVPEINLQQNESVSVNEGEVETVNFSFTMPDESVSIQLQATSDGRVETNDTIKTKSGALSVEDIDLSLPDESCPGIKIPELPSLDVEVSGQCATGGEIRAVFETNTGDTVTSEPTQITDTPTTVTAEPTSNFDMPLQPLTITASVQTRSSGTWQDVGVSTTREVSLKSTEVGVTSFSLPQLLCAGSELVSESIVENVGECVAEVRARYETNFEDQPTVTDPVTLAQDESASFEFEADMPRRKANVNMNLEQRVGNEWKALGITRSGVVGQLLPNLAIQNIDTPTLVRPGEDFDAVFTVKNKGDCTTDARLTLLGTEQVATVEPDEELNFSFTVEMAPEKIYTLDYELEDLERGETVDSASFDVMAEETLFLDFDDNGEVTIHPAFDSLIQARGTIIAKDVINIEGFGEKELLGKGVIAMNAELPKDPNTRSAEFEELKYFKLRFGESTVFVKNGQIQGEGEVLEYNGTKAPVGRLINNAPNADVSSSRRTSINEIQNSRYSLGTMRDLIGSDDLEFPS